MNTPRITMSREDAQAKLRAYRSALRPGADAEYEAAVAGYRALAKGTPLIDLTEAFAAAPLDAKGRVRLAIARADEQQVELRCGNQRWTFEPVYGQHLNAMRARTRSVMDPRAGRDTPHGYAMVPMVPPDVRGTRNLAKCWTLWEVEAWADAPIRMTPDFDPLLLRHLHGTLYAVLGQWDLTALERAIMQGRAR